MCVFRFLVTPRKNKVYPDKPLSPIRRSTTIITSPITCKVE